MNCYIVLHIVYNNRLEFVDCISFMCGHNFILIVTL